MKLHIAVISTLQADGSRKITEIQGQFQLPKEYRATRDLFQTKMTTKIWTVRAFWLFVLLLYVLMAKCRFYTY